MPEELQDTGSTQVQAPPASDSQSAPPAAAPSADPGTGAAPAGAGSPPTQTPPHEAPSDGKDPTSLTPPKSVASHTQSPGEPAEQINAESYKRLRDEKSTWARKQAELSRQADAYRTQLAQLQQEREKANQAAAQQKLPLHDFRHPEHAAKFQPILAKADIVRQQLAALAKAKVPDGFTPEQAAMWQESQRNTILSSLSEEEQGALEKYQSHDQEFRRKLSLNPAQTLQEFVMPMVQQVLARERATMQAQADVQRDLQDPALAPILKEYEEPMAEMISKLGGTDEAYDFAVHHARMAANNKSVHEENARLKQQLAALGVQAGAAKAQQDLAKGKASITKDVVPRQTKPSYEIAAEWAAKNRVEKDSPQFFKKLREIDAQSAR